MYGIGIGYPHSGKLSWALYELPCTNCVGLVQIALVVLAKIADQSKL